MSDKPSVEDRLAAFFGAADEPEQQAAPERQAPPEPPVQAQPEPEQAPIEASAEPAEAADEVALPQDLDELAAAWGVDVAKLYDIQVPITDASGRPAKVKLGEWKDGYQESAKLRELRAVEQVRVQEVLQAQQQKFAEINQRAIEMDAVLRKAEERLLQKASAINWNALREADPAEWTAKRVELQEEAAQIEKVKAEALQNVQQAMTRQQQEQMAAFEQVKNHHRDWVRTLVPDFADPEKATARSAALKRHMLTLGYSEADTEQVWDARFVKAIDDSYTLAQLRSSKAVADKKVESAPKRYIKPGVPKAANAGAQAGYKQARAQLRKSGKLEDAMKLFNIR